MQPQKKLGNPEKNLRSGKKGKNQNLPNFDELPGTVFDLIEKKKKGGIHIIE